MQLGNVQLFPGSAAFVALHNTWQPLLDAQVPQHAAQRIGWFNHPWWQCKPIMGPPGKLHPGHALGTSSYLVTCALTLPVRCHPGSAELSADCCVLQAYAAARMAESCLLGLEGENDIYECAYVESNVTKLPFFASKVRLLLHKVGSLRMGHPCSRS